MNWVPIGDAMTMQRRILHSWKEIASYVGRGVRTIQRYEAQFGLPVHRPAGSSRSAVMAFSDEIDAWFSQAPTQAQQMITVVVKASQKRSSAPLKDNHASNGNDICPFCCGTGKISNSKHVEARPGSESILQTEN